MKRGNLAEIRPGEWRLRLSVGKQGGKYRQRSASFHAKGQRAAERQATAYLAQWDAEAAERSHYKDTVRELVCQWLEQKRRSQSPTTEYRQRSIVARIVADLGDIRLAKLTAHDIDLWYNRLADGGMSANTVRHYHRVLHAILRQGRKWGKLPVNVADDASPPRAEHHDQRKHMPTLEALGAMIGRASPIVRVAVLLAIGTGCRRGELVGLRWSDLAGDVLTVRRSLAKVPGAPLVEKVTKSDRERVIPLDPALVAALVAHREEQAKFAAGAGRKLAADGPILAHLRGDPTGRTAHTPDWLSQEWERLCKRCGIAGLKLHGLRHLHASLLLDAHVPPKTVQLRQGHQQASTTLDIYGHPLDASDLAAAATMGELMAPLYKEEA